MTGLWRYVHVVNCLLVIAISFTTVRPCQAQNRRNRVGGPRMARIEGKGLVIAAQNGMLQIKDQDANPWLLQVKAKPQDISVTGTADKDLLTPGMFVRFSAELNKEGESVTPVESLTLFTPRPLLSLGIAEESALNRGAFQFGEAPEKDSQTRKDAQATTATYLVAGKIMKRKENELVVSDGKNSVKVTLAEAPEIKVDLLGDYRMLRPGDEIEFRGEAIQPGKAIATELKIKGATPFGAPGEPPAAVEAKERKRGKGVKGPGGEKKEVTSK